MNQSVRDFKLIVDSGSALYVKMSEMFFNILVFCVLDSKIEKSKKCQKIDPCVKMAENQCENVRILKSSSGSAKQVVFGHFYFFGPIFRHFNPFMTFFHLS